MAELAKRFDMDHEINLPTWFSSSLLLVSALLLGAIGSVKRSEREPFAWHWLVLAATFAYLSLDETANLHEMLIVPIRRRLGLGGVLYFAWVLPGAVAVAAFGLAFVRFLRHLDPAARRGMLYAAVVYVGGALGMELIGGAMADSHGFESIRYITVMMAEEALEMLGLIIFITTLLRYIAQHFGALQWRIDPEQLAATR